VGRRRKTYDAVELAPFISEWLPAWALVLACAELAEVLGGLGDGVGEEV
jgi:hypothetical protein